MGSLKYFISAVLFFTITSLTAQYNTGSDDLNKSLVRIDADASVNFGGFKADLSGSYDITEKKNRLSGGKSWHDSGGYISGRGNCQNHSQKC